MVKKIDDGGGGGDNDDEFFFMKIGGGTDGYVREREWGRENKIK